MQGDMMISKLLRVVGAAFAVLVAVQLYGGPIEVTTIAFDGQPALAPAPGVFSGFQELVGMRIGNGGDLYFYAGVQGSGVNAAGTWAGKPDSLTNVFRSDMNAPGVDGRVSSAVAGSINSQGQYLFEANLNQEVGYSRDDVLWFGTPGNLQVAAREGDPAPGVEATTVYSDPYLNSTTANFENVQLNDLSQITFTSSLRGPGVSQFESGLWIGQFGQLQLIARTNHQVPGLPMGENFLGFDRVQNPFGTMALTAELSGTGITSANNRGVWIDNGSGLQLVARSGDPAPGVPGATFLSGAINPLDHKAIDSSGNLLIGSSIAGPGIDASNNSGYWYGPPGNLNLLLRTGQSIPGFSGTIKEFFVQLVGPNRFVVDAHFTGPGITSANDSAIFEGTANQLNLIAREGMQAPGEPAGVQIGDVFTGITSSFVANSAGQLAVRFTLTGTGVTTSNGAAYYMTDSAGNLFEVLRQGSLFDVGNGVMKVVTFPNANFGFPNEGTFNDAGQFLFATDFADNTHGVFIVQVVPEPTSLVSTSLGILCILVVFILTL